MGPEVVPVHFKAALIIEVHHLVSQGVLHEFLARQFIGAEEDAIVGREAAELLRVARGTSDRHGFAGRRLSRGEQSDMLRQKANDGT